MKDTPHTLSRTSILLHWLVAIGFIAMLAVGLYMANTETWALYEWHKSLGILLFAVILWRVVWRLRQGWPPAAHHYPRHELILAKVVHWVLLLGTIALPLTGMLYSGASGHGFGIFGLTLVPENHHPLNPPEVVPYSVFWNELGHTAHRILGYVLVAAIALHLLGALKHHFIDRDRTLLRQLGR